MTDRQDDEILKRQKIFLDHVEYAIRVANRKIIHRHVQNISEDDVLRLAMAVGELRARYLAQGMKLIDKEEGVVFDAAEISRLAKQREAFDEATQVFEALRRAIERGYVDVS